MESLLIISSSINRFGAEDIPDSAYGVNQLQASIIVHLITQQPNKSIEGISFDIAIETPDGFDQGPSPYDSPGAVHELFEQVVFRPGEPDPDAGARYFPGGGIQQEIIYLALS